MSEIKKLAPKHLEEFIRIVADAYPGFKIATEEDRKRTRERLEKRMKEDPTTGFYALFRRGEMQGVMRLHDFTMTFVSLPIPIGGVGLVAVDLAHKREKVAKEMIAYFLRHCRKRSVSLAALYPFRPDFYKRMGFGYGTKTGHYRLKPSALPRGPSKRHLRFLKKEDLKALGECHHRVAARTHGLCEKTPFELKMLGASPSARVVGYVDRGIVKGYLVFQFRTGKHEIQNPIEVMEWIYESPEALAELATFLQTQADQVQEILFSTQDEHFHHLPLDPRNGTDNLIFPMASHETNTSGVGIMYRVVSVPGLFRTLKDHRFGGQTCKLKITLGDSFLRENQGSTVIHFEDGRPTVKPRGKHEAEIRMEVAEFSSLVMGVVPFKSLLAYGQAWISNGSYTDTVNRLFLTEAKPVCITYF